MTAADVLDEKTTLANNLASVQQHILHAKSKFDAVQTVSLCVVSKAQSADRIRAVYEAGHTTFGENYLQEALNKQEQLRDCAIAWHFIGPIQSNKTQPIARHFDWVHSVDRLKIAQRLSDARPPELPPLNICLQVNISHETSKSGASGEELLQLALSIKQLPHLHLRGLMAIPAPCEDFNAQRDQFRQVRQLFEQLNQQGLLLDTLSIGMSGDFAAAIAEGSTLVRIGTAIFGARPTRPPSTD
ncbi:YggS family pyridoxal phosphate-dependent enzyme [Methylophilus aquaticus]|uniref:Pyridoxal phosphate homeostasis protein n=1 Tax=Methylophilus aquaticus TaxID=1971610 RepID=A0ABT9JWM3_9PROT|nr:YggS family pyridoxal phosphate-dependent enzyme [Methylophilus aquaticus]MDP8568968.1 YggS family pyridoxal phosphate-dependent enzyme [Methylophilus aquaticus]